MDKETPPLLSLRGLQHHYDDLQALADISFDLYPGSLVALVGANGAGKSTLLSLICGLLPLQEGHLLHGCTLEPTRHFGFCPQQDRIWPDLTVQEQLRLLADLYEIPAAQADQRIEALLQSLDLRWKAETLAGQLSGGMKRRLSLAMALIHDPPVLILDEADAGLDPQSRVELRAFLRHLASQENKAILLATHSLEEVEKIAHRILFLHKGALIADGSPGELIESLSSEGTISFQLRHLDGLELPPARLSELRSLLTAHLPPHRSAPPESKQAKTFLLFTDRPLDLLCSLHSFSEAQGLEVFALSLQAPSLEDVFLARTGRPYEPL